VSTLRTSVTFLLPDEAATLVLAARMARSLPPAGQPLVLYLRGDLGTGKTTLARGILQALGERGPVRSPTYGLISEYAMPQGRVVHLDLYRLRTPGELQELGLADLIEGSRLWLIEWPEQAQGERLPPPDGRVLLEVEGEGRRLDIEPVTGSGKLWLAGFSAQVG
jgi:tRNA threonylcarbamoyladenosine biosynthesis protein TsaE